MMMVMLYKFTVFDDSEDTTLDPSLRYQHSTAQQTTPCNKKKQSKKVPFITGCVRYHPPGPIRLPNIFSFFFNRPGSTRRY